MSVTANVVVIFSRTSQLTEEENLWVYRAASLLIEGNNQHERLIPTVVAVVVIHTAPLDGPLNDLRFPVIQKDRFFGKLSVFKYIEVYPCFFNSCVHCATS